MKISISRKNLKYLKGLILTLAFLAMPVMTWAKPLVSCGGVNLDGTAQPECDFEQFVIFINNLIHFLLYDLTLPLAAVIFCYAGFIYLTSNGSTEKTGKAKKIMKNVVIGLLLALAGFLIIKFILVGLGYDGPSLLDF